MRAFELSRRRFAQASLAALAASACAPRQEGDIILHGGPIYTGLGNQKVEALRLSGGRVAFAGALADAQSAGARMIDLGGAAAFPGFVDGHVHLGGVGMAAMVLDLVGVESIAALQARLRDYAAAHPQGPIYGRGWIETHWPERRFPNAADLDAIVSDRPVLLERVDGHAAVANTNALNLAGISNSTPNPDGGAIERGADGAATGMLIDRAAELVQARFPAPTPQMRRDAMAAAVQLYAARGWAGAANMSTSLEEAQILQDLAAKGELPLAADLYLTPEDSPAVYERGPYADDTGLVHVRGVKLYMDGALGSRGAAPRARSAPAKPMSMSARCTATAKPSGCSMPRRPATPCSTCCRSASSHRPSPPLRAAIPPANRKPPDLPLFSYGRSRDVLERAQ